MGNITAESNSPRYEPPVLDLPSVMPVTPLVGNLQENKRELSVSTEPSVSPSYKCTRCCRVFRQEFNRENHFFCFTRPT